MQMKKEPFIGAPFFIAERNLVFATNVLEKRSRAANAGKSGRKTQSFLLLMILLSSSIKLLMSLNWRYTDANRT